MKLKFYDENGKILSNLYDETASKIANELVRKTGTDKWGNSRFNGVSSTQLRRLFDEVKRFERNLKANPDSWEAVLPLIKMIKSKSAYSTSRAIKQSKYDAKYYSSLNDFIKSGIDNVKEYKDYKAFCLLFEAVYGFYYELGGNKK